MEKYQTWHWQKWLDDIVECTTGDAYRVLKEFPGGALKSMFSTLIDPSFNHTEMWNGAGLYIRQTRLPT